MRMETQRGIVETFLDDYEDIFPKLYPSVRSATSYCISHLCLFSFCIFFFINLFSLCSRARRKTGLGPKSGCSSCCGQPRRSSLCSDAQASKHLAL